MKKTRITKIILTSLFFILSSFVFAIDNVENSIQEQDDGGNYAKDGNGNAVKDSSGKKIHIGTKVKSVSSSDSVPAEKNILKIERDDILLTLNGDDGTFAIYGVAEQGEHIPLLSTYDSKSGSYFAVQVARNEYKLQSRIGIKCEVRKTPLGAQMAYLIPGQVQVVLDFSFMPSIATSTRMDMLRISAFVINIGRSIQSFSLKSVFDTTLGENTESHFSTATKKIINSEVQFQSMDEELWIRSSNKNAAIQFIFGSKEITKTDFVTLATKNKLDSVSWIPSIQTSRSFNSVTSFNNSGICINWPRTYLDALRTANFGFYISVATGGNNPAGKQFLVDLDNGKSALGFASRNSKNKLDVIPKPIPISQEELDRITPNVLKNVPSSSKEAFVKTKEITESQLDPEYIQKLLDRIATFNEDENVDKEELKKLNEELDLILHKLGAQR